jgi:hypothetical protein
MIFHWLGSLLDFLAWLLIPRKIKPAPIVDENERCHVCGATRGHPRCVERKVGSGPNERAVLLQITCLKCGARTYRKPLDPKVDPTTVYPAIARDELERSEDAQMAWGVKEGS